jgi:predicted metal-dependent phosphoesterase TrpH
VNIDLHIHSDASDGTHTPPDILEMARQAGLAAISITDHDTVAGVQQALAHGIPKTIRFLTGIEISAAPPEGFSLGGSFHLLGYGFRPNDSDLNRTLTVLQEARRSRYPRIIDRLNEMGIRLSVEDVSHRFDAQSQIGRPHIARLLVDRGVADSIDDAFDRFLGKGQPAFVDKRRIPCREAIVMIRNAGGVAALAHPSLLTLPETVDIADVVGELASQGLQGIEVEYPGHAPAQKNAYRALARRHGLLMTGGSDFHGNVKPEIRMGTGRGDLAVPFRFYEEIVRRIRRRPPEPPPCAAGERSAPCRHP